ncbi:hypothetical protein BKP35_06220 [Anaerobacillus arseniciselenatis]|uniref:Flagellar Assembly Protein A N-terminal region domain-containing protein n=1 Tax=Anaerobacillus arseniciselenatis TaxID=85682 RepID=A0A1S2LQ50_9BACI|nr:flagellar assembly protein A [Anaerobacillus arseniciselenatis]OIJ14642.1 hypothetical protein BKP35_06220 [Anaerobacillus arseniciselenatis]
MRQGSDKELIDLISQIDQKEKQRKTNKPTAADEEVDKNSKVFTIKPEENDGYITVKNNEIFIKDGEDNGQQPSLIPNDNLTTLVNGKQIDSETIVSEGDEIRIKELSNSSPYHILISEDKLKVTFQLKKKLILKEAAPTVKLKVDVIEITPSLEIQSELLKVREDLIQLGIRLEINLSAIMTELLQPTFEEIVIVQGSPPVQGKDGFVEYYFKNKKEEVYEEVGGKINFKNRFKIPTVEAGNIIGKVHEAIEGKEGVNVFGESIYPKKPKPVNIRAKENVNILSNGQIVMKLISSKILLVT